MSSLEVRQNLEFEKVLGFIANKCVSELGIARLKNTQLMYHAEDISVELNTVEETKSIFLSESGLPVWSFSDIRPLLAKIEPLDSHLDVQECQQIQNLLEIISELIRFFEKHDGKYPLLYSITHNLDDLHNLHKLIISTIEPSGAIYDNASPELKRIRHDISGVSKQINIKLDRILNKQSEHLQENYITLREGRLVLPVREFSVNRVPGIVHGQSASGQTHFVEPFTVVSLNNEMHELYMQEKREIIQILKRITNIIRENTSQVQLNQDILVQLDALQAKAQYALSVNGIAPDISQDFEWNIIDGFHPLLIKKPGVEAVPLSLTIGGENHVLIITGPNAGGKTVALKTLGLLQLLFQSGFHLPVKEKSHFPVCEKVFAVIGDEQSIEDDLSTFSSHITKLNKIVSEAGHRSLILIDEIGTGTDPSEGSALAIAVLEELNQPGIVTVVTTHHSELKVFAHKMEHVRNAAMQFDRDTLAPKFQLELGIPGSSYAFDISRRLGVKPSILGRAQKILGESHHDLEEMILALGDIKQRYQDELAKLSIKKSELQGIQALYRTRSDELNKKKKQFEKSALEEAQDILSDVNKTIETVVRQIRESNADRDVLKKGRIRLDELKKTINQKISDQNEKKTVSVKDFKKGMYVRSQKFSITGQVAKVFRDKNEVELEMNGIKIIVPVNDLLFVDTKDEKQSQSKVINTLNTQSMNEVDVRGMTADDAVLEVDRYLDTALNSDWQELRIIHGKGTGVLRQRIHTYLKKNKNISSFRLGRIGEGDTGVTIVERH